LNINFITTTKAIKAIRLLQQVKISSDPHVFRVSIDIDYKIVGIIIGYIFNIIN